MSTNAKKSLRDKDILFSIVLLAGSIWLIIYSLNITGEARRIVGADFHLSPGLMTLVIGIALAILSGFLMREALRQGGDLKWLAPAQLKAILQNKESHQTVLAFFFLFLYIFVLWEKVPYLGIRVPFWLATFIFLNLMMITFKAAKLVTVLIITSVASGFITYVFKVLVRVPLP